MKRICAVGLLSALLAACASDGAADIAQRIVYDDRTRQRENACEGLQGDREAECLYEARKPYEKRNDPPVGGQ